MAQHDPEGFGVMIVERLLRVIEQESADVRNLRRIDYDSYNSKKSQGLLEISRLLPSLEFRTSPALIDALQRLEAAIAENQKVLSLHLAAASTINALIARAVRESQSDGTYCVSGLPYHGA